MDYQQLIDSMTPDVYDRMRRALEVGKWPDGRPLTPAQREQTMQAVILWGERHLAENERVGFIDKQEKEGDTCDSPEETTLKWQEQGANRDQ